MAKPRRLSKRQRERIGQIQEQRRERLHKRAAGDEDAKAQGVEQGGEVVVRNGRHFVVIDAEGKLRECVARTNIGHPVCGDRVVWQETETGKGIITALLERSSVLARPDFSGRDKPLAANIDRLIILIAPQPEPSPYLIDQYLVTAELIGIPAIIAINKVDLLGDDPATFLDRFGHYREIGYSLIAISAKREHGLDPIIECLRDHTGILLGQSGVGKSSLINALLPDRDVQVGMLSEATGLGRHTTSAATRYTLPHGGHLIDSPGVRSFRLANPSRGELERGFREFAPYLGRCRFADCRHDQEPECAIRGAVEAGKIHPDRLGNFLHMVAAAERGTKFEG